MDKQQKLAGKIALVTGSSRGIGRFIAQRLAAAGATVIVTGRSATAPAANLRWGPANLVPGTLAETVALIEAAGGKALALAADLEKPEDRDSLIDRAVAMAGQIDILVNNAGYADYARIEDMPMETFDRTIDHYLKAPFALSQAAIRHMKPRGAGWIVNLGSVTAYPPTRPYLDYAKMGGDTLYASCKAAIHHFTRALAAEMVDHNIAVNCVGPSTAIRTPGADALIPADYPTEDPAYLAATVLDMCQLPAAERTGLVAFSMHYPHAMALEVMSLDGTMPMPPATLPAYAHPSTSHDGY
jgi:3-oxoacyl-[acyl-carrier protein] reductase